MGRGTGCDHVAEVLVHRGGFVELRMEGGDQLLALAGGNNVSIHDSEGHGITGDLADVRGANEGHRNRSDAFEGRFGVEATQLAAIGIAGGGNVHGGKMRATVIV